MFLNRKKKEDLSDQYATYQERKAPRWGAPQFMLNAGITIEGFEGEGQLGNVSITGCSMQSITYVNITPNEVYHVRVLPAVEDNMRPFTLILKLNWIKSSETLFQAGFSVEGGDVSSQLRQYVELLRSRGILPDYGNMEPKNR